MEAAAGRRCNAVRAEGRFLDIQRDTRTHPAELAQQSEAATANEKGDRV